MTDPQHGAGQPEEEISADAPPEFADPPVTSHRYWLVTNFVTYDHQAGVLAGGQACLFHCLDSVNTGGVAWTILRVQFKHEEMMDQDGGLQSDEIPLIGTNELRSIRPEGHAGFAGRLARRNRLDATELSALLKKVQEPVPGLDENTVLRRWFENRDLDARGSLRSWANTRPRFLLRVDVPAAAKKAGQHPARYVEANRLIRLFDVTFKRWAWFGPVRKFIPYMWAGPGPLSDREMDKCSADAGYHHLGRSIYMHHPAIPADDQPERLRALEKILDGQEEGISFPSWTTRLENPAEVDRILNEPARFEAGVMLGRISGRISQPRMAAI